VSASLVSGYHLAFVVGASCVVAGFVLALALLRPGSQRPEPEPVIDEPRDEFEASAVDLVEVV
jgi:hypothetical protein